MKFFDIYNAPDMLEAKSSFGHFSTNEEITICGGTSDTAYSMKSVEIYDLKQEVWLRQPDLNYDRRLPSMCLFRRRWIYVFGGTQHRTKSEVDDDDELKIHGLSTPASDGFTSQVKKDHPGSMKKPGRRPTEIMEENEEDEYEEEDDNDGDGAGQEEEKDDFGEDEEENDEEDADALSAGGLSDNDSYIDLEEEEQNYELDFGEHYVHQIERLDMQTQRGKKKKWEVLKLRTDVRIEGQQFGAFQFSQEEIILFGTNFKSEFPHFSEMQIYKFSHDQKQVT